MPKAPYRNLTFQVLTAIAVGILIGHFRPAWGEALGLLGDAFLRLVKMVVAPIIFLTIVVGIASMGDLKKVGRIGVKALIYFEVVTTVALAIGLLVANLLHPGAGVRPQAANQSSPTTRVSQYTEEAQKHSFKDFALNVIPDNVLGAFAKGDLVQVLFFSVLFGIAVSSLGLRKDTALMTVLEHLTEVMFRIVAIIMKVAPLGALGAMAYTVGHFGIRSLTPLMKLMGCVYLTMAVFIFLVLGAICRLAGVSLWRYLVFIREEILLVLGTSSSESALPRMIERLELLGCGRGVVGMVIPAGYSFNLDGTSIYLSMAVLFIAQALHIPLDFGQQVTVMAILMLTSKGSAAVTGGGFVTLAATLSATHVLPVEGLLLLIGVDRFMSESRAITNLIGNGVATIVVSKWEGEFDPARYRAAVSGHALDEPSPSPEIAADMAREPNADTGVSISRL